MTLQQLRYLIAIAEYGSINAAAQNLYASQSNLSTAIKELEQELGISIFTRKNGRIIRVADEPFSPGDDFCIVWPIFDLLPGGAGNWDPKYKY